MLVIGDTTAAGVAGPASRPREVGEPAGSHAELSGRFARWKGCRVTEPWAQSYENLHPNSRAILRGMAVLGLRVLPGADLPGVAGTGDPYALTSAVAELVARGWLVPGDAGEWLVVPAALPWLADRVESAHAIAHVERVADHLLGVLTDARRADDATRGPVVVATVRAAGRYRLSGLATAVAGAAWRHLPAGLPVHGDRTWWQQLAEAGEEAATAAREPVELIGLLDSSAAAFARAGETHAADRQWQRAFALADQLGDHERSATFLHRLGALRRTAGSFGKALTAFHELVAVRQHLHDRLGTADALTELATTMVRAGRGPEARHFLRQAEDAIPDVADPAQADRAEQGRALIRLGRCWDQQEAPAAAMACYSKALAALIDVDDAAAEVARTSLAAAARARAGQRRAVPRPSLAEETQ
jgi:hypothetical protein